VAISDLAAAMASDESLTCPSPATKSSFIKKGLLYAPEQGQLAFTVPGMHTFIAQQD